MGLLSKATSFSERVQHREQKGKAAKGLLTKAAKYSEPQAHAGLLEKAAQLSASEESEVEEAERSGLLQKAQALSRGRKEGLLKKAEIIAEREEGLLEKVEVVEGAEEKEGLLERAWKAKEQEAERAKKGQAEAFAPVEAKVSRVKKKRRVTKAKPKEAARKEKTPDRLIRQYLQEKDVLALVGLYSRTSREMGHEALLQIILKTATDLCKAKKGVLLALERGRYRAEEVISDDKKKRNLEKLNYREGSKLVRVIKERWGESFRLDDVKQELSKRDLEPLEPLAPSMVFPLITGMRLIGFLIIGNIQNNALIEQKSLFLLSHISAPFISDHILKEELQSREEELSRKKEERDSVLSLYDYFGKERKSVSWALERLAALFHIETAVLVTGWDTKGGLEIACGIGITDEETGRFKLSKKLSLSKRDRELGAILRKGEPKIPKDVARRISALSKELEREFKTYIAVPVSFHDIHLAVLLILDMKGAGKKLPKPMKDKLKSISGFLVPYLLYNRLIDTDPYLGFEFSLEQEIRESEGSKYPLHLVIGTVKGTEKGMKDQDFAKYRNIYDRLYKVCKEVVAESGRVSMVSWKRIILIIRAAQSERVDGIINHIKERFTQILKKEKQKLVLTFKKVSYQGERMSFYEILSMVY